MKQWILLVEDQPDDVFFFQSAAKKAGIKHEVAVATDGRAAVERLRRVSEDRGAEPLPALVLLDLKLPYFSGLEVLEWMRGQEALKTVPVVMLTSSEQTEDIAAAYRLGAFGYLVKAAATELLGHVRAIDEFWLKRNRFAAPPLSPAEFGVRAVAL